MASLSQWTWVWASSRSWCWTAWHAAVHGVARTQTQLKDWTELNWCITESICSTPEINTTLWINYISIKNCKSCNVPPINNIQQWKEMLGLRSITLWLRDSHLNSVSLRFLIHKYFTGLLQGWSEQDFVRVLNYKNYLSCLFRKKKLWLPRFLFFSENYIILSWDKFGKQWDKKSTLWAEENEINMIAFLLVLRAVPPKKILLKLFCYLLLLNYLSLSSWSRDWFAIANVVVWDLVPSLNPTTN